uniref:Uncharacterized protein n=1 Tax=Romanomermis culicivorax TaxID=13658 RepID=A0A915HT16_ROMCU
MAPMFNVVCVICWFQILDASLTLSHYAKRFADDVYQQRNFLPQCTKTTSPCRCTQVYPREIVIECKKATLKQVQDSMAAVSNTKMQILAVDIYGLILKKNNVENEFYDNFFAKHSAVPRALVVQDCRIERRRSSTRRNSRESSSSNEEYQEDSISYHSDPELRRQNENDEILLNFAPDAFKSLEDILVTLKIDCPTSGQSLEAIKKLRLLNVLQLNHLKMMPEIDDLPFEHLIHLDLRKNGISKIGHQAFNPATQLENVNLAHNELKIFETSIFDKLINLNELDLSNNKITSIVQDNFSSSSLSSLEHLDLSRNLLTTLGRGILNKYQKLKILKLESNTLSEITTDQLDQLINLEILSLHDNPIHLIYNFSMQNLTNLKNLYLSQACISSNREKSITDQENRMNFLKIDPQAFHGLINLQMLDFDCTIFQNLDGDIFNNTPNLKYLILANSQMINDNQDWLNENMFKNLKSLTHLYLAGFDLNLIKNETTFLEDLISLRELNLVNYTPIMPQCNGTPHPKWLDILLDVDYPRNFTVTLPNCLPNAYQRYYRNQ